MLALESVLSDKITLDIGCVDRVYLNGYVKYLQMPGGVVNFIREQIGWPRSLPKVLYGMTTQFRTAVESFASEHGLEGVTFEKGDDKDAIAREHLAGFEGQSGVVLIGKVQEKTSAFKGRRADQGSKVWFNGREWAKHRLCKEGMGEEARRPFTSTRIQRSKDYGSNDSS